MKTDKKVMTIPNMLSMLRLGLIPIILWLYLGAERYILSGIMLILSGITDVVDGYVARRYDMTSDLGKVLDPIADKATQGAVIIMLSVRFSLMLIPLTVGLVKEVFMAISGYMVIKRQDIVLGAEWHGKVATFVLTAVMLIHLVWYRIDAITSALLICLSAAVILISFVLYAKRNFEYLLNGHKVE